MVADLVDQADPADLPDHKVSDNLATRGQALPRLELSVKATLDGLSVVRALSVRALLVPWYLLVSVKLEVLDNLALGSLVLDNLVLGKPDLFNPVVLCSQV